MPHIASCVAYFPCRGRYSSNFKIESSMDLFPAYKIELNPNAKEFVPASSRSSSGGGSAFVMRDPESDHAFLQRLKESRDYWDLDAVPSYMKPHKKLKCASCKLNKDRKNHTKMLKDLTHDVVNLLAYYHDCEDKAKKYECKYCVEKFNGVVNEEDERYACPEECGCDDCEMGDYSSDEEDCDFSYEDEDEDEDVVGEVDEEDPEEKRERMILERKREKAHKKRNQREHMAHLKDEHERKLRIILYFKQDLIPMCGFQGFFGDANCEWGLGDVLNHVGLNKGHKFLQMEEPPRPESPRSPKAWQYMMGMENDDYELYNFENEWDSD